MYPYLPLTVVLRHVPAMRREDVSVVARSRRGFLVAYRRAAGDPAALSDYWNTRRAGFVARHMAQVRKRGEPLFDAAGEPTRRHLALIAWAYSPYAAKVAAAQPRHNPETAQRSHPDLWL